MNLATMIGSQSDAGHVLTDPVEVATGVTDRLSVEVTHEL
ncbi:hypothetical protein PAJL_2143 [Cutibacterium acnes HL042PA3]|nr:hypothetical protein PAJL_2143 [Cutibacterium acnes HL042PA3]